jgi:Icc-related predicted phosphoesterase
MSKTNPAMKSDANSFTFASIGDLHVKDNQPASLRETFGQISKTAGALVLCGDLTDTGTPTQAEILAEELRACTIPVIGVLGNHDYESGHADQVKRILCDRGVHLLDGQAAEVNGVAFIGVKGFAGGFGPRMLSSFGEPAIKTFVAEAMNEAMRLENIMRTVSSERAVVVLHYAPIAQTLEGEPLEIYPFLGCSRLAETIDRFKVSAVVHGHAHRGKYEGRTPGGARVYNVAKHVQKPSGLPYALISV